MGETSPSTTVWIMPTYQRPERCQQALDSIAAMALVAGTSPPRGVVMVDGGSRREEYRNLRMPTGWNLLISAENRGLCWRLNEAFDTMVIRAGDNDDWSLGFVTDDLTVRTQGWDRKLAEAAGRNGISSCDNGSKGETGMSGAVCFGGRLLKALGFWVPRELHHYHDAWETIGRALGNWTYVADVLAEAAEADALPNDLDKKAFQEFKRTELLPALQRAGAATGRQFTTFRGADVRLAICVPFGDYRADWRFMSSLFETMSLCGQYGIATKLHNVCGGSHVGKAREALTWMAMASDATHLLFIDSDMGWDPRLVMRLIASGHDFAAVVGVKKQDELQVCCNFLPNPQPFHDDTGFLEIREVGFAFVLLKRAVIEKMHDAYPELRYRRDDQEDGQPEESALFLDMIDPDDRMRLSEDFSFCRRWRKIGGEIYIDHDAALIHIGRKEYTGAPAQLFNAEQPPASYQTLAA